MSHGRIAKTKSMIYWKTNLKLIYVKNVAIERAHWTWKKNKNRSRPIVAEFSSLTVKS